MRPHLFLLPACMLTLAAQDAWEALVKSGPDRSLEPFAPWVLVRKAGVGRFISHTEELKPAWASGDFRRWGGSDEAMVALGRRLGISPPSWALVDPTGEVRLHGTADPTGKALGVLFTLDRKADVQRFREEGRAADPTHGAGQGRVKP